MENNVYKKSCCNYYLIVQWNFSPCTAHPCKISLSSRTNYNILTLMIYSGWRSLIKLASDAKHRCRKGVYVYITFFQGVIVLLLGSSDKLIIIDQPDCFGITQQTFAVIKSCLRFDARSVCNYMYNKVNGTLVKAQCDAARKRLLLLSDSWTNMTSQ